MPLWLYALKQPALQHTLSGAQKWTKRFTVTWFMTPWRNGSASDSRSERLGFESFWVHELFCFNTIFKIINKIKNLALVRRSMCSGVQKFDATKYCCPRASGRQTESLASLNFRGEKRAKNLLKWGTNPLRRRESNWIGARWTTRPLIRRELFTETCATKNETQEWIK